MKDKVVYVPKEIREREPNTRQVAILVTLDNTDSEDVIDSIMLDDAGFNDVQASYDILQPISISTIFSFNGKEKMATKNILPLIAQLTEERDRMKEEKRQDMLDFGRYVWLMHGDMDELSEKYIDDKLKEDLNAHTS